MDVNKMKNKTDYAYVFENDYTCQWCDGTDLYGKRDDPISNFAPSASPEKILDARRSPCVFRSRVKDPRRGEALEASQAQKVVDEDYAHKL